MYYIYQLHLNLLILIPVDYRNLYLRVEGLVLAHNHPSGDPTPSREDIEITKQINEAAKLMNIEFLDHIIIGDETRYLSLKEKGHF